MAANLANGKAQNASDIALWSYKEMYNYGAVYNWKNLFGREILIEALEFDEDNSIFTTAESDQLIGIL